MVDDMQAAWDAAVAACLNGHANCSYGGMTPGSGYWLAAEDCPLDHGNRCSWCPEPATTGFGGWADNGFDIYAVPACQPHADAWVAEHPEWARRDEPEEEAKSLDELLAEMDPVTRAVWQEADRRMMNLDLYGDPDGSPPGFEPGGLFAGFFAGIGDMLASAPETGRWRYNQQTKTWEQ